MHPGRSEERAAGRRVRGSGRAASATAAECEAHSGARRPATVALGHSEAGSPDADKQSVSEGGLQGRRVGRSGTDQGKCRGR